MRRLWAYIVLAFSSLVLMGSTLNPVFTKANSNIEYQQGREIVFRVSNKEDTKNNISELVLNEDGERPVDVIAKTMETRLENSDISLYNVETMGEDTVKVTFSEEYSSNYNNLIIYLTFNGDLGLTNGVDDIAKGEDFLTDEKAYVDTVNGYPSIIFPVNVENSYYKAVLEGVERARSEEKGFETSTNDAGEEVKAYYLYLWYDFDEEVCLFENKEETDVSRRLLNKFQYPENQEDLYFDDDEKNKLCFAASISGNTVEDRRVAYENARFYANLINASKLDYKVTYMYDRVVDGWAENIVNLGNRADSIAFKYTALAATIAFLVISAVLVIEHKLGGLAVVLSSLLSVYASLAIISFLSAEFTTFGLLGLIAVCVGSIASGLIYMAKIKDEAYKGRSMKKANSEASKKSIAAIVDINAILMIVGAFVYILGGPLAKTFAAVTFVGGLFSMLINLLYLRGMVWLVANNTKFQGKYNVLGIMSDKVPSLIKEEKQTYFGAYAGKDFTKKHKPIGIALVSLMAVSCIGMGVFGGINDGEIYRQGNLNNNSAIYLETTNNTSLAMKEDFIVNNVLNNLYTYDETREANSAIQLSSIVDEYFFKTYSELIEKEEVERYVYVIKLNKVLSEEDNVFYKKGSTTSRTVSLGELADLFSEDYKNTYEDLGLFVDTKLVVSFKEVTRHNSLQPNVAKVILGTCVGLIAAAIYMSIRYRLSRGIAALMVGTAGTLTGIGFFSVIRAITNNYVVAVAPAVSVIFLMACIAMMSKEKELIVEDRSHDNSLEARKELNIKAIASAYPTILGIGVAAIISNFAMFTFGPGAYASVFAVATGFSAIAMILAIVLVGPLSMHLEGKFKNIKAPKRSNKKKTKKVQQKSAEPEEAVFIGIND